jgi:hypothetical protein
MNDVAFKVGTTVALWTDKWSPKPSITSVSKVYKNGNFLLESTGTQQYKPYASTAQATGDGWNLPWCRPMTPEIQKEIENYNRLRSARDFIKKVDRSISRDEFPISENLLTKIRDVFEAIESNREGKSQ